MIAFFLYDQRLPAFRDSETEIPMLGYGTKAKEYVPYMDFQKWDENTEEISPAAFYKLYAEMGGVYAAKHKGEDHDPYAED